jgi:hypothetical protein
MTFTGAVGVPAPAVSIGMAGLIFPLWAIAYAIFAGYEWTPDEGKSIGATCLVGCFALSFQGFWHIIANPLGGVYSIIFAVIPFMYALTWLVGFFVNTFGFDGKTLGDVCLMEILPQGIAIYATAAYGITQPMLMYDLIIYLFALLSFYVFTHGYGGAAGKYFCGLACFLSWVATVHLEFWWSGIFTPGPIF